MTKEIGAIYRQIADGNGKQYKFLFSLEGLFLSVMDFDPVTDEPLPVSVDDVLYGVDSSGFQNDRLQHIVDFVSSAVRNLIDILHEKSLREHRITRPEQVRELDSKSMMWLAKKPGFTVKQKIASEQKMMGVYHTTSLDTAENRLFKAFMQKLDEILLEKENAFHKMGLAISDEAERFTSTVHRWLKSDEAECINRWNNTPPNNTLLNDKNYRKIWKAHLMLQNLSEQIQKDLENFDKLKIRALFWFTSAKLNLSCNIRFRQNLLFPDYQKLSLTKDAGLKGCARTDFWEKFEVFTKIDVFVLRFGEKETEYYLPDEIKNLSDIHSYAEQVCADFFPNLSFESKVKEQVQDEKTQEVAAVDLNSVFPTFTLGDKTKGHFSNKLLHQSIFVEDRKMWLPCSSSRSKLVYTRANDIKTFSIHSIFDEKLRSEIDSDEYRNAIEKACSDFAKTVKDELHCQKCLYITSDDSDDFSPSVNAFKHSMNSAFSKTEIVPRSIATLFCHLSDIQKSFKQGDKITVRAIHDDYEIKTNIRISFDEELSKQNPETKGLFFQRLGFERIELENHLSKGSVPQNLNHILTMQDANLLQGNFSADDFHFELQASQKKIQKENNEILIYAGDDTSFGAIEYERLQKITPEIPLWCDFLPKLSMVDSTGEKYVLVEPKKVSIRPIVGKPVHIPISWEFSFPSHKSFYEFPLFQGEKKEKSKYFAFIKEPSFPLERETKCSLYLTYTYGMPLPYNLAFIAVSNSAEFKSVVVKWENKSHKDYIHDMPVPNFVREYTWKDLKTVPARTKDKPPSNIPEKWLPMVYENIRNSGIYMIDRQLDSSDETKDIFSINSPNRRNIICEMDSSENAEPGDYVWCCIVKNKNKPGYKALHAILIDKDYDECQFSKSIKFPALMVWNNGRSIYDEDCPLSFKDDTENILAYITKSLLADIPLVIKNDLRFFLSCMHKDMPEWFKSQLPTVLENIEKNYEYSKWIAYALGDCSKPWQKDLLSKTIDLLDDKNKAEYAIKILAKALWRVNGFVFNLSADDTEKILSAIRIELYSKKYRSSKEEKDIISACLECIVALCRLRNTEDHELAEENRLRVLSMSTNDDVKLIVTRLKEMKKEDIKLKTFLTFEIERLAEDHTPELLYAAYGYLSGEIESNAIKVLEADFGE